MRWALTLPLALPPGLKRRPTPPRCPGTPHRRCRLPPRPALLRPARPRGGCPLRHLPRRLLLGHSGQPGVPALPSWHVPQIRLAANRVLHVPARLLERPRRRLLPPLRARHRGAQRGDRARPRHRHLPRLVGGAPAVGQRADGAGAGGQLHSRCAPSNLHPRRCSSPHHLTAALPASTQWPGARTSATPAPQTPTLPSPGPRCAPSAAPARWRAPPGRCAARPAPPAATLGQGTWCAPGESRWCQQPSPRAGQGRAGGWAEQQAAGARLTGELPPPLAPAAPATTRSCPPGFETRLEGPGAGACTPCQEGFFAPRWNTTLCQPCPAGQYSNTTGGCDCVPAEQASVLIAVLASNRRADGAAGRPPSPARRAAGATSCQLAAGGWVTGLVTATATGGLGHAATGAVRPDPCPARQYRPSSWQNNTCSVCPDGRETLVAQAATLCHACPPGTTHLAPADVACTECPPGSFVEDQGSAGSCEPCPPGRAVNTAGARCERRGKRPIACRNHCSCSDPWPPSLHPHLPPSMRRRWCPECGPGSYAAQPGQATCERCPAGTANALFGAATASACVPCAAGTCSQDSGWDWCDPCPPGSYQDKRGQTACKVGA